jgi:putative transposase
VTDRPLSHLEFPYVFLDATYVKAHEGVRVVSKAIVIVTGVARSGDRELLGLAVGDSEDGAFWTAFLRSLRARGLSGVKLVISDAHEGLKSTIARVFLGTAWQRCRVHFMRNVLAGCPEAPPRWWPPPCAPSSPTRRGGGERAPPGPRDRHRRSPPSVATGVGG